MGTVCFTGYRPEKLPFRESEDDGLYLRFRETLYKVIKRLTERGYTDFISGVAMGFDTWVAEDVLALKKSLPEITLECAVPFPGQAARWSIEDQLRRERILENSDRVTTVSPGYSKICFFTRNRYMVDKSSVVVCCYDGKSGGTAYTVDYAKKRGKTVIQINPSNLAVSITDASQL